MVSFGSMSNLTKPSENAIPTKIPTTEAWPRKLRFGRTSVSVYRRKTPGGNFSFLVANYTSGSRRLDAYPSEAAALKAARRLAEKQTNSEHLAGSLRNSEAAEYISIRRAAGELNLLHLVTAATNAVSTLGNDISLLTVAARDFVERKSKITREIEVTKAVEEYLENKTKEERRPTTIRDIRQRLGRFARTFQCPMTAVTASSITEWLDRLGTGRIDRRNYLAHLRAFFNWCEERGYIHQKESPVTRIKAPRIATEVDPGTYTPDDLRRLLEAAPANYKPIVALMAFAGLRPAEALRLTWEQIHWDEGHIVIAGRGAKTRTRRLVPILDALREWIPNPPPSGSVWPLAEKSFHRARTETKRCSGVEWLQDGLRHTWISARVAITSNAAQVALDAGNSPEIIFKHYRALKTKAEAEAWFDIRPQGQLPIEGKTTQGN